MQCQACRSRAGTCGRTGSNVRILARLCSQSANGHEDVVDALVTAGANLEARTLQGETALSLAARHRHRGMVALLLQRGTQPGPYAARAMQREGGFLSTRTQHGAQLILHHARMRTMLVRTGTGAPKRQ